jgi:hypothetical protein
MLKKKIKKNFFLLHAIKKVFKKSLKKINKIERERRARVLVQKYYLKL